MKIFEDLHTHTIYSDGKSTIEENVQHAVKIGLKKLGISDHGYGHLGFGVKYEDYPKMRKEMEDLQAKYPQIKLSLGVECNILDDLGTIDIDDYILSFVDYVIAGYHFGSTPCRIRGVKNHICNFIVPLKNQEIQYNTNALVNAMANNKIDILAHPGDKGNIDIEKVAIMAEKTGTILEINQRHHNLTYEQLLITKNYDIRYILSSDAHKAQHIGVVDDAYQRAVRAGIDREKIVNLIRG